MEYFQVCSEASQKDRLTAGQLSSQAQKKGERRREKKMICVKQAPHLKVMAEAELQGLGGELEAALQKVDLGHEEVGLRMGRVEFQTVLQTALRGLHITCTSTTSPS